jgi:hypothetical protein
LDIELEDLNDYRFYKLAILPQTKCDGCGGMLWLYRDKGTILRRCMHTDCLKVHEITRQCTYCGKKHDFEDTTCDKCENKVINLTTMKVTIEECDKAIKKINRQYKNGLLEEQDWKGALKLNQEEKAKCEKNLKGLMEKIGYQFTN